MEFAAFRLIPTTPLHLGARRTGMVARTHRFLPGHVLTYALTAAIARARGARSYEGHEAILAEVCQRFRFGPAFILEGETRLSEENIEHRLVTSRHHVTLEGEVRAAVEGALFELEVLSLPSDGSVTLAGGVWGDDFTLDGRPLADWLGQLQLGGEWKTGCGRVRCSAFQPGADTYPGIAGLANGEGIHLSAGKKIPGPALDGVTDVPWQPWIGRRYDAKLGYGRRLSKAVLVRMNGWAAGGLYQPCAEEPGLGCWRRVN